MRTLAILSIREWSFKNPVFPGDTIHVVSKVLSKEVRARGRRGEITWQRQIFNQDGKLIMEGVTLTLVEGRAARGEPAEGKEEGAPTQTDNAV
jgi:acyl dehydratase